MIIIAAPSSPTPKGKTPQDREQAARAEFDRNFVFLVDAFERDPLGKIQNAGAKPGGSPGLWTGKASDVAKVGLGVEVRFDMEYEYDGAKNRHIFTLSYKGGGQCWDKPNMFTLVSYEKTSGDWNVAEVRMEIIKSKRNMAERVKALSSVVSKIIEAGVVKHYPPRVPGGPPLFPSRSELGFEAEAVEFCPNSLAKIVFNGEQSGVLWTVKMDLGIGNRYVAKGALTEVAGAGPIAIVRMDPQPSGTFRMQWPSSDPPGQIAKEILERVTEQAQERMRRIDVLLPGARRAKDLVFEALAKMGWKATDEPDESELSGTGEASSLRLIAGLDMGNDNKMQFVFFNTVWSIKGKPAVQPGVTVESYVEGQPTQPVIGDKSRVPPEDITLEMVTEGLLRVGVKPKFEARDEGKREAIQKVNNGDLLGAIQAAADLIDKRMEEPEFFQSYLAALQAANAGNGAAVAEFVNSL